MLESQKFNVRNATRDTLLSDKVTLVDASEEHLDQIIGGIAVRPGTGLWIKPCMGAPIAEGAPPFDLLCIDPSYRVVEFYESFETGSFMLFPPKATSALIFPAHTIGLSLTQTGDALEVAGAHVGDGQAQESKAELFGSTETPAAARTEAQSELPTGEAPTIKMPMSESPRQEQAATTAVFVPQRSEKKKEPLSVRFMRWLVPDRRKTERVDTPHMTATRWAGDKALHYAVEDVSLTGLYLVTEERPYPGTVFMVTLRRANSGAPQDTLPVLLKVMRWGPDGLGMEFVTPEGSTGENTDQQLKGGATTSQIQKFFENF
jgi:PilZ domain